MVPAARNTTLGKCRSLSFQHGDLYFPFPALTTVSSRVLIAFQGHLASLQRKKHIGTPHRGTPYCYYGQGTRPFVALSMGVGEWQVGLPADTASVDECRGGDPPSLSSLHLGLFGAFTRVQEVDLTGTQPQLLCRKKIFIFE